MTTTLDRAGQSIKNDHDYMTIGVNLEKNECRMFLNVARFYRVIEKLIEILEVHANENSTFDITHNAEDCSILINYTQKYAFNNEHAPEYASDVVLVNQNVDEIAPKAEAIEEIVEEIEIQEDEYADVDYLFDENELEEEYITEEKDLDDTEEVIIEVDDSDEQTTSGASSAFQAEYSKQIQAKLIPTVPAINYTKKNKSLTPQPKFKCQFTECNNHFYRIKEFDDHMKSKHYNIIEGPVDLQCKFFFCDLKTTDTFDLYLHYKDHSIKKCKYKCTVCEIIFNRKSDYIHHRREHAMITKEIQQKDCPKSDIKLQRKCSLCDDVMDADINIYCNHYVEKHSATTVFECFVCLKPFLMNRHFQEHVKTHSKEIIKNVIEKDPWRQFEIDDSDFYECRLCLKVFSSKKVCHAHQWTVHYTGHKYNACSKCGGDHRSVKCSINKAEIERSECVICGKILSANTMNTHLKLHTDKRNYACTVCKKRFKDSKTCHRHIQIHINSKNKLRKCFECDEVMDEVLIPSHYETTHPEQTPYNCIICKAGYCSKTEVTDHTHTHSLEERQRAIQSDYCESYRIEMARVIECKLCKRVFNSTGVLKSHLQIHIDRPLICEVCNLTFRHKTYLEDHLRKAHRIKCK